MHALLGGQVKVPASNRGIYGIFPSSTGPDTPPPNAQLGPHHDNNPFDLGGVIYMSKVGPLCGGYTVVQKRLS